MISFLGRFIRTLRRLSVKQIIFSFRSLKKDLMSHENGARLVFGKQGLLRRTPPNTDIIDRNVSWSGLTFVLPQDGLWRSDLPKPFDFNLHTLDFLRGLETSEEKLNWILEWKRLHLRWDEIAWHPYTASCRAINLICIAIETPQCLWLPELIAVHAATILKNIEWRVGANHLLLNGIALSIISRFIQFSESQHWKEVGDEIVYQGLREQWCADGGHFERSIMYHRSLAENLLVLFGAYELSNDWPNWKPLIEERVNASLQFAHSTRLVGDRFPLLNDSSLTACPSWSQLQTLAESLNIAVPSECSGSQVFPEYGLAILKTANWVVSFDCGPLGPSYQPGHGHADTLSIEAFVNGIPLVVDPGVFSYDISDRRIEERSSVSHNAPHVCGISSSEVWSSFRVGQEAKAGWDIQSENSVAGYHDGYSPLKTSRIVSVSDDSLKIEDEYFSDFSISFILAENWKVNILGPHSALINHSSGTEVFFETSFQIISEYTTLYCEQFFQHIQGRCVKIKCSGKGFCKFVLKAL